MTTNKEMHVHDDITGDMIGDMIDDATRKGTDNTTTSRWGCRWIKSSHSTAAGNCIELATLSGVEIGLRDSKDINGPVLRFPRSHIMAFIHTVR